MRKDVQGTVYLLCFRDPATAEHRPYKHAGHYIGWAENLDSRIAEHRRGGGARLISVIQSAGLTFDVVRTWKGTRKLERNLKGRGGAYTLCPLCREAYNKRRNALRRDRREVVKRQTQEYDNEAGAGK